MPRLMGVDIPNDKQIQYSLTYLYGIGLHSAREVCEKFGIDPAKAASDIQEEDLGRIAALLERDYTVEGPLRQLAQNIGRLRKSSPTEASGTAMDCPSVVNAPRPTPAPAKVLARRLLARRVSKTCDSPRWPCIPIPLSKIEEILAGKVKQKETCSP